MKMIMESGGIPFVKTNTSQCNASMHAVNNIYGEARNPLNFARAVGGEEGLVSVKCAPFTLGNDNGFLTQAKSAFSGVFNFRPTRGRISDYGMGFVSGEPSLQIHK